MENKNIAIYIEVAKKPFTLKGFHVKGGFLLLKNSTGKTLGVSSGWHSNGCLAVYPLRDDGNYMTESPCGRFIEKRLVWASYGDDRFPCVESYLDYIEELEQTESEREQAKLEQAEREWQAFCEEHCSLW